TQVDYYNRKAEYMKNYSAGLTGEALVSAQTDIDTFFERRVRGEWEKLLMFSEVLYDMLRAGNQITVRFSGYASPLSNPTYNKDLTLRRIESIRNHFKGFGGIYLPYLNSEQLKIEPDPKGDTKAPPTVSKDPKLRRLSVYSVDAARERRVEIVGVDVTGNAIPFKYTPKKALGEPPSN
ncbi:MAG: hypothetical protein ACKVU2_15610, partial [Saprospiraceae bacterium]